MLNNLNRTFRIIRYYTPCMLLHTILGSESDTEMRDIHCISYLAYIIFYIIIYYLIIHTVMPTTLMHLTLAHQIR